MHQIYLFRIHLNRQDTSAQMMLDWLQTLTGMTVTLKSFKPVSMWAPNTPGLCEIAVDVSRDEAIQFYNLVQQHHPIDALQTL